MPMECGKEETLGSEGETPNKRKKKPPSETTNMRKKTHNKESPPHLHQLAVGQGVVAGVLVGAGRITALASEVVRTQLAEGVDAVGKGARGELEGKALAEVRAETVCAQGEQRAGVRGGPKRS